MAPILQMSNQGFRGPAWAGKQWGWTHSPTRAAPPAGPGDLQHLRTPTKWLQVAGCY